MIAVSEQSQQTVTAQQNERFLEMLPLIRQRARLAFRRLRPELKEELVAEAVANAFCRFSRLVCTGRADLAFPTPLADFAIRQVIAGRQVGNKQNCRDVSSAVAQRRRGFTLQTLSSESFESNIWCEILADDSLTPVPDQAAFRLDFSSWLRNQNCRKRELAKFLALGNTATEAARCFGVSIPRISQLRSELHASWQQFQGERS
jgi:hypothetical protein